MASAIGDLVVRIGTDSRKFDSGISRVIKRLGSLGSIAGVTGAATGAITAMGTAAMGAATAIAYLAREEAAAMDVIGKRADRIGMTTEALVALEHQAQLSGASVDAMGRSLDMMNRKIGEVAALGKGEAQDAFKYLGLDARQLAGMTADQQFAAIADKMELVGNKATQAALAAKIFGRNGAQLLNVMKGGSAAMAAAARDAEYLGLSFDAIDASKARMVTDEWYRANAAFTGVRRTLASDLAPALGAIAELFTLFFVDSRKNLDAMSHEWSGLSTLIEMAVWPLKKVAMAQLEVLGAAKMMEIGFARMSGASQSHLDALTRELWSITSRLKELEREDWGAKVAAKYREIADAAGDAADVQAEFSASIEDLLKRLEPATDLFQDWLKQVHQFNMTDREKALDDLMASMELPADSPILANLRLVDQALTQLEAHAERLKVAEKLKEQFADPFDTFATKFNEYQDLLQRGLIDEAVYERAVQSAFDTFTGAAKDFRDPGLSAAATKGSSEAYSIIANAGKESDKIAKSHLRVGQLTLEEIKRLNRNKGVEESIPT